MKVMEGLYYTNDHEWLKLDGTTATIGISDYAQEMLGDVAYIELPDAGESFAAGDAFGVVESTKMASDLYMPVSGTVLEKNTEAEDDPGIVNRDAYGAWLVKIELTDAAEVEKLLDAATYEKGLDA
ncbi:MAG: glycine cleavage system protein GcvH [Clostridiales Family XIII bacterium]|jgi:glycine cleavage system H protein|nr:glycine cleavage system protein GcvH [Clostridiales Family XIII bacterium]